MSLCPMCGSPVKTPTKMNAEALLHVLRSGARHREVYRSGRNPDRWFVTYDSGEATATAVTQLVEEGKIQPVYSNCPDDSYHVGRTWDCERTLAARKILGKAAPDYFVGDA